MQQINDNHRSHRHTDSMSNTLTSAAGPAADLGQARVPGLLRRLATMLYDLMLLVGVLVVAAAVFYTVFNLLTGREAITGPARLLFQAYLLAVIAAYYVYFWTGGRQTLGMRSWRTLLLRADGGVPAAADALRRLAFAALTLLPLGAGLLWVLFDRDGLAWYDRLSGTRPVLAAKRKRKTP
jgi:uncharacterized RDD family membrane protein YckC